MDMSMGLLRLKSSEPNVPPRYDYEDLESRFQIHKYIPKYFHNYDYSTPVIKNLIADKPIYAKANSHVKKARHVKSASTGSASAKVNEDGSGMKKSISSNNNNGNAINASSNTGGTANDHPWKTKTGANGKLSYTYKVLGSDGADRYPNGNGNGHSNGDRHSNGNENTNGNGKLDSVSFTNPFGAKNSGNAAPPTHAKNGANATVPSHKPRNNSFASKFKQLMMNEATIGAPVGTTGAAPRRPSNKTSPSKRKSVASLKPSTSFDQTMLNMTSSRTKSLFAKLIPSERRMSEQLSMY